jgi:hypothetical protein
MKTKSLTILISIIAIFFNNCDKSYPLGVAWNHHISDENLIVNDSSNCIINYCVPDTLDTNYNNWSKVCLIYQAYYDQPDYIINVPKEKTNNYLDTVKLISNFESWAIYCYIDNNGSHRDTLKFIPEDNKIYSFGYQSQNK